MTESWGTRWYTPLVVVGVAALVAAIVALAIVEALVSAAAPGPSSWSTPLERANLALRDGDLGQALAWWREARQEALRSGGWEGMIEVGDASRRLGVVGGFRPDGDAQARQAYMTALLRARREQSVDGVLRAAVAFGELGDREVAVHAIQIAQHQAARNPRASEHVRAVADRWMSPSFESGHPTLPGGSEP